MAHRPGGVAGTAAGPAQRVYLLCVGAVVFNVLVCACVRMGVCVCVRVWMCGCRHSIHRNQITRFLEPKRNK